MRERDGSRTASDFLILIGTETDIRLPSLLQHSVSDATWRLLPDRVKVFFSPACSARNETARCRPCALPFANDLSFFATILHTRSARIDVFGALYREEIEVTTRRCKQSFIIEREALLSRIFSDSGLSCGTEQCSKGWLRTLPLGSASSCSLRHTPRLPCRPSRCTTRSPAPSSTRSGRL